MDHYARAEPGTIQRRRGANAPRNDRRTHVKNWLFNARAEPGTIITLRVFLSRVGIGTSVTVALRNSWLHYNPTILVHRGHMESRAQLEPRAVYAWLHANQVSGLRWLQCMEACP